jgi:hypothetical protein
LTKVAGVRDVLFACALTAASVMVSVGVGFYTFGAGLAVGGVLLAGLAWLILGEAGDV